MIIVSPENRNSDSISKNYFYTRQVLRFTNFTFRVTLKNTYVHVYDYIEQKHKMIKFPSAQLMTRIKLGLALYQSVINTKSYALMHGKQCYVS